jgi:4-amino-4-deoxy-L-arabinose transferase-like glycosyltransferase
LPFALLGILALTWQRRFRFQQDRQQVGLILWGFWLLTMAVFFTLDSNFHQYYMTEMAPGLCALVGIGLVIMWQDYRRGNWRGWLLPVALAITAGAQIFMLASYPTWARWMSPLIGCVSAVVVLALLIFKFRPRLKMSNNGWRILSPIIAIGLFVLLLAPTIWAGYSVFTNVESSFPTAGPNAPNGANNRGFAFGNGLSPAIMDELRKEFGSSERFGRRGNGGYSAGVANFGGGSPQVNRALIAYLEAHQGSTTFLVATPNASTAESIILATNKAVMAMGGFSGSDPIPTVIDLQSLIKKNSVHYFLVNGSQNSRAGGIVGGFGFGGFSQSALSSWITSHCSSMPANAWSTPNSPNSSGNLYYCSPAAA